MTKFKIKLETANNVALFVALCGQYKCDIDIQCGRFVIDAKSLMGMLSFSPDKIVEVILHENIENIVALFEKEIRLWRVEE